MKPNFVVKMLTLLRSASNIIFWTALLVAINSCDSAEDNFNVIVSMKINGVNRTIKSENTAYLGTNLYLTASQKGYHISLTIPDAVGLYSYVPNGYISASLGIEQDQVYKFYSMSSGIIHLTQLLPGNAVNSGARNVNRATGTFNFTAVNLTDQNDTLTVTDGEFNVEGSHF